MRRLIALGVLALACRRPAPALVEPPGVVVARVNGEVVREDVVRAAALRERVDARAALQMVIDEVLLAQEAERRGLAPPWAREDARWHARVRKYLEDQVEVPVQRSRLPEDRFAAFVASRRAALCHDGLRRVIHAVFRPASPPTFEDRARRLAAAQRLRARIVAEAGPRPSADDFRRAAIADRAAAPNVESLPPFDRLGGMSTGGNLVPGFVGAVWALPSASPLSPVFETSFGVHLALVVEELPPSGVSCASLRPRLAAEFEFAERSTAARALIDRLRARAVVHTDTTVLRTPTTQPP